MIIGVIGKKRSGKDSIAKILCDLYSFQRYGFADPIKEAVKTLFGWNNNHVYGDLKEVIDEKWGISPRQVLQHLGTNWAQHQLPNDFPMYNEKVGKSLWVKKFNYWFLENKPINVVITDVRFPHELKVLKELEGKANVFFIKVIRNTGILDSHESESYIESLNGDFLIENNDSLETLKINVVNMMLYLNNTLKKF
jgi:hypothetical protein